MSQITVRKYRNICRVRHINHSSDIPVTLIFDQLILIHLNICRAHVSLGVTHSETEHSTGGCFKLL